MIKNGTKSVANLKDMRDRTLKAMKAVYEKLTLTLIN